MGPVFSGSIIVSMAETKKAEIPNFTGGEAANITQQGNPYIFRTSFTQTTAMPKVARYIANDLKAKTVAIIWVNNDFGKGGRDTMVKELEKLGVKVVADISTDPGQVDFSGAVLKAKQSNADALFVYINEEESARALRELRKQGYDKPIVGETVLTSQKVIELAGDAANGAVAHVGLTADAPQPAIKAFDEKFQKEYKNKGDHNALKGYSAMYIVKVLTERLGKVDPKAFAAAMHGAKFTVKDNPGVLLDVTFDNNGDLDRESFMTKVVNGKQQVDRDAAAGVRQVDVRDSHGKGLDLADPQRVRHRGPSRMAGRALALAGDPQSLARAIRHSRALRAVRRCRRRSSRRRCAGLRRSACAAATSPRRTSRRSFRCSIASTISRAGSARSTPSWSRRTARSPASTTTATASSRACAMSTRSGVPTAGRSWCSARAVRRARSSRASRRRGPRKSALTNRTLDKAQEIADAVGAMVKVVPWEQREDALDGVAMLANATSLGMAGKPPLDMALDRLPPHAVVGDLIYIPPETPLLAAARARGNVTVNGLGLLLNQARPAFNAWFGVMPEITPALRAAIEATF